MSHWWWFACFLCAAMGLDRYTESCLSDSGEIQAIIRPKRILSEDHIIYPQLIPYVFFRDPKLPICPTWYFSDILLTILYQVVTPVVAEVPQNTGRRYWWRGWWSDVLWQVLECGLWYWSIAWTSGVRRMICDSALLLCLMPSETVELLGT